MAELASIWLFLFVIGGLYLLIKGADHLVDGSSALALQMGVSPLLIGLTLVAFGTSAPELATCLRAIMLQHELPPGSLPAASQFALGNVVGSNICNLAFVLGAAVMLVRITVDRSLLRRELPFLVALTIGFVVLVQTVGLDRPAGIALLVGPEGGLTDDEVAACEDAGATRVRLGETILRTETAVTAALAAVRAHLDLN